MVYEMESCLPPKHHLFTIGKKKGSLFMHEDEVMAESDFYTGNSDYVSHSGSPPDPSLSAGLGIGSPVQLVGDPSRTGVIRWIGTLPETKGYVAGVELVSHLIHV